MPLPDHAAEYFHRMEKMIARHGHGIQFVYGDQETSCFAYTIGLQRNRGYELLIAGINSGQSETVLNTIAARFATEFPVDGAVLTGLFTSGHQFRVRRASHVDEVRFAWPPGGDVIPIVWQATWADEQGHFPGDPDCSMGPEIQKLF